ncbi:MAG: type 4a pilus biogenesis protein PilO [Gammaproteobacteria bacterium]|nr:type 4a pilus biogenesis protein PilO [Gammaproteobacteria bacterium]
MNYPERLRVEWASLDWREVGAWSASLRAALMAGLFAVVVAVGGWGVFGGMAARNETLEAEERTLRNRLAASAAQVANLDQLRTQGAALEAIFADWQARLSTTSETAGLIEGITEAAEDNHLSIEGIELTDSHRLDHYAELPVSLRVSGTYHQLGAFAGSLANLPHILTLHDFEIESGASGNDLRVRIDLKTYLHLEEP